MNYSILSNGTCSLLNIENIGYSKDPKITRFGPGQRNQYIIHYVISGKGYFNGNALSAGQGFLITPGLLENYYSDSADPWSFLWIISSDEKMKDLFPFYNANPDTLIFDFDYVAEVKSAADMLVINKNAMVNPFETLEIFLSIFNNHIRGNSSKDKKNNPDIYIDFAVNYIKSKIDSNVTVSSLTEILGISQSYLFKIFKKKFGISTKQYINEYRITFAKKLLKESNLSVTQVAASVGFNDVLSFSKFFSKNIGISPLNYRIKNENNRKN